jgi:hypothetical protein
MSVPFEEQHRCTIDMMWKNLSALLARASNGDYTCTPSWYQFLHFRHLQKKRATVIAFASGPILKMSGSCGHLLFKNMSHQGPEIVNRENPILIDVHAQEHCMRNWA